MRKLRIIAALLLALCGQTIAFNKDSLIALARSMRPDTSKINVLYKLAVSVGDGDSVAGYQYADEILKLGRELKYVKGMALGWQAIGRIAYYSGNLKKAIPFLEKSEIAFKECKYSFGILDSDFWLACCYRRSADYPNYGKYLSLMEDEASAIKNESYLARAYEGYGNLYRYLGQYSKSIEYYTQSIDLCEKNNRMTDAAVALNNLSLVYGMIGQPEEELRIELRTYNLVLALKDSSNLILYLSNLSSLYQGMNKMDTAWRCIEVAMDLIKRKGEENLQFKDVASVYGQYATLASLKKDYKTAVDYQNKNVSISRQHGDVKTMANGFSALADIFLLMGNKTFAEEYYLKSLVINKEIGFVNGQMMNYQSLESFYRERKNQVAADTCAKLYALLKDSVEAMSNQKKLMQADAMYKLNELREQKLFLREQAELERQLEEKKKWRVYALFVSLGLTVLLIVYIRYRSRAT